MKNKTILMIFALFTMISCASNETFTKGSYIRFTQDTQTGLIKERLPAEVKIYYKKSPDYKFIEIGIVEAMAQGVDVGLVDLFPELKKQATKMGSDAVYKIELQRYNQTGDALHATGIAIKKQ